MKTYDVYKAIEEQGKRKFRRKLDNKIYEWDPHFHRFNLANNPIEWIIPGLGDEWEEVKEPVDFMDALRSGKKVMIKHQDIDGELSYMSETYNEIDDVMYNISNYFTAEGAREILLNGEWYIED